MMGRIGKTRALNQELQSEGVTSMLTAGVLLKAIRNRHDDVRSRPDATRSRPVALSKVL